MVWRTASRTSPAFRAFLQDGASAMDLALTPDQVEVLGNHCSLVRAENRIGNLTALTSDYEMAVKHVLDSLTCLVTGLFDDGGRLVDIGSGAGFPGVPLKVLRPDLAVSLADSSARRASFLARAVSTLELEGLDVMERRAEVLGKEEGHREAYGLAVIRAVSGIATDLEYAIPLIDLGGHFIAMKGPRVLDELGLARRVAEALGARFVRTMELTLPLAAEGRVLVVFEKVERTPRSYPRRPGIPAKRPLS